MTATMKVCGERRRPIIPRCHEIRGAFQLSEEEKQVYEGLLRVSDDGIMGYVEIPSINVELPIYHGTDEEILQIAVGHIQGSSLPVGGPGTHCVISGA